MQRSFFDCSVVTWPHWQWICFEGRGMVVSALWCQLGVGVQSVNAF
jgi:hypothetical protein